MPKERSKIYGVGINDSTYPPRIHEQVNGKVVIVWACPIFITWKDMMKRCYSEAYHKKRPSYKDCTVCEEWWSFSNFHKWARDRIGVDHKGRKLQLDKDLLVEGNTVYSPNTCVFISTEVNNFLGNVSKNSGSLYLEKRDVYQAFCKDPFDRYSKFLGDFSTEEEARKKYWEVKLEYLDELYLNSRIPYKLYFIMRRRLEKNAL